MIKEKNLINVIKSRQNILKIKILFLLNIHEKKRFAYQVYNN